MVCAWQISFTKDRSNTRDISVPIGNYSISKRWAPGTPTLSFVLSFEIAKCTYTYLETFKKKCAQMYVIVYF